MIYIVFKYDDPYKADKDILFATCDKEKAYNYVSRFKDLQTKYDNYYSKHLEYGGKHLNTIWEFITIHHVFVHQVFEDN